MDKHTLVKRLLEMGEIVGVTGDGTNDAPALHEVRVCAPWKRHIALETLSISNVLKLFDLHECTCVKYRLQLDWQWELRALRWQRKAQIL
jgi:hypothetical protein